jgi:hypothetical protein
MSKKEKKTQKKKGSASKSPKRKPAVALDTLDSAPSIAAPDDVALGTLSVASDAAADSAPASGRSMQKKRTSAEEQDTGVEARTRANDPAQNLVADESALRLPRGGFVAFRKSGGLDFSTREVVVYPDGRVAYDVRGVPQKEYNRLRRALNDGQIAALRHSLDETGFWKEEGGGEQNPDAFAYEIAARLGQRSNEIQVFDGSVPERLRPLIEQLTRLLPD